MMHITESEFVRLARESSQNLGSQEIQTLAAKCRLEALENMLLLSSSADQLAWFQSESYQKALLKLK